MSATLTLLLWLAVSGVSPDSESFNIISAL